ncbi:MAG: SLC13 family permease [Thermodesulfobacteriota bacterium]
MSSFQGSVNHFWSYLWGVHEQTKQLFSFGFRGAFLSTSANSEHQIKKKKDEEDLIEEVMPGGSGEDPGSGGSGGGDGGDGDKGDYSHYSPRQKIGLAAGPLLFLVMFLIPTPEGMSPEAHAVLASTVWIAVWWISEAIPIPATSLLPIVLFPLTGAMNTSSVTPSYANHLVFLFMGGFMIALSMEKWNLHRRIALNIILLIGGGPKRVILGFMMATAFLSMWISNTATTMMMVPIGLAVILQFAALIKKEGLNVDVSLGRFAFGTALMLGIAYSASIGGVATLIGTPPNAVFAGVVKEMYNQEIGFGQWMTYGVPLALISLLACWYYLTNFAFKITFKELPGGQALIRKELSNLGPIGKEELRVLIVFAAVAFLWLIRGLLLSDIFPGMSDATIAMLGALVLFAWPVDLKKGRFLLDWETMSRLPWGILILFGGGFAIARGFSQTGLAEWIATRLQVLEGAPILLIIFAVVTLAIFLTEITSNTATSTMLMPVMAAMAIAMGMHPYALMAAAALACSFAFMLPVATPPNAIVFASGYISIPQMARAGFFMNLFGVVIVTLLTMYYLPLIWGIDLVSVPGWAQ